MMRNTTFNLPDELIARAKAYAAGHGTTVTAIVREHLETVTGGAPPEAKDDPLLAFSKGKLSKELAIRALGLRDYAELLLALGEADLPLPALPPHEIDNQAALFASLWRRT